MGCGAEPCFRLSYLGSVKAQASQNQKFTSGYQDTRIPGVATQGCCWVLSMCWSRAPPGGHFPRNLLSGSGWFSWSILQAPESVELPPADPHFPRSQEVSTTPSSVFNLLCNAISHPFLSLTLVICEMRESCWPHRFDLGEGKGSEPLQLLPTLARGGAGLARADMCSVETDSREYWVCAFCVH